MPERRILRGVALTVLGLGAALVALGGCTNGRARYDASTAPVLVPIDVRFRVAWGFSVDEAADNYTARAHWDPSFNDAIDRSLRIESYQINDPAAWTGELPAEDDATSEALRAVLDDGPAGPCEIASEQPLVWRCVYDVGRADPLPVLVRRFGSTVMLVLGDDAAANDYITGDFEPIAPSDAEDLFTG